MTRLTATFATFVVAIGVSATTLHAQADEQHSYTSGFSIFGGVTGAALTFEGENDVASGGGLALSLGFGVSPRFSLQLAGAGALMQEPNGRGEFSLGHFDIMIRHTFADATRRAIPYIEAGYSGRAAVEETPSGNFQMAGAGVSAGGGLQYFLAPPVALDGNLRANFGRFSEVEHAGRKESISLGATSTRLAFGISWFPGAR